MNRVWVTGIGAVTPGGWTAEETWRTVRDGRSCTTALARFPSYPGASSVAGVVPGREDELPDTSLAMEYGTTSAREALAQAGLSADAGDSVDVCVVGNHGERRLPDGDSDGRLFGGTDLLNAISDLGRADRRMGLVGACAASTMAIGACFELVRSGRADSALAGGMDACVTPYDYFSMSALYALSTRDCPPEEASCPFDKRRDGFVLSEGAAFLVLESEERARARGAEPLAEISGFGLRQTAHHMFAMPPDGRGPVEAMEMAMRSARLDPSDIDYVNAHGTSTHDNDIIETLAIHKALGPRADEIPVSSSKSQLGHTLGAAGSIESVVCVLALRDQVVPPTTNLVEADDECDLDYVPGEARPAAIKRVLNNSFAFGGHACTLVLERP